MRDTVETSRRVDSHDLLVGRWADLPQLARELTLSPEWLATAAAVLHEPGTLRLMELFRGGTLAALAPLAVARSRDVEGSNWQAPPRCMSHAVLVTATKLP